MILQLLLAIAIVLPGIVVLVSKRIERKTISFFLTTLFLALWSLFNYLVDYDSQNVTFWTRLTFLATMFALAAFFDFTVHFPKKLKVPAILNIIVFSSVIILSLLLPSKTLVTGVTISESGIENVQTGSGYVLMVAYYLFMFITVAILLNKQYKVADSKTKLSVQYVYASAILMITLALLSNLLLPLLFNINILAQYGGYTALLFSMGIGYAMLRQHLFDIRVAATRATSYVLSLFVLVLMLSATVYFISGIFNIERREALDDQILFVLFSVVVIIIYQPIKKYFDKVTSKIFYHDAYDAQVLINEINSAIVNTDDLHTLLGKCSVIINEHVMLSFSDFYIAETEAIDFHVAGTDNKLFGHKEWVRVLHYVEESSKRVISREDVEEDSEIQEAFNTLEINTIFKMDSHAQTVGYLIVGEKSSGNSFTQQDIKIFTIISDVVAIAAQNSIRLQEIERFNETLQENIRVATIELQRTNEKLRTLDEAKDEFISMASHQLRTPLTSIKGYISMILEGDAGEINEQQKNFLNQAFISSQRMVYLIADLLNVSRLKTGKFMIETQDVYLPDVVATEVDQLITTSEARGLKLKYKKPKTFPVLQLDETKTRQVIMNFIDNAIYYTPKGGTITLELKTTDRLAQLTVTDDGIGVPKHEQHQLFTKFYRAGNAKKARPDGTGLGLFMAKKVVVAQGGTIIFKSTEGKGSTFGFSFPLPEPEATP